MERKEEINIIIKHLQKETIGMAEYPALLRETIVRNGKLIEQYMKELNNIINNEHID